MSPEDQGKVHSIMQMKKRKPEKSFSSTSNRQDKMGKPIDSEGNSSSYMESRVVIGKSNKDSFNYIEPKSPDETRTMS